MKRIYRVSGLQAAGSASVVARTISKMEEGLRVRVDVEEGLVHVRGPVSDYRVAEAVMASGCKFLGPAGDS